MSGSEADPTAAPTVLFVLPWSPDSIGGVSEVVINLFRVFAAKGPLKPRLLIEAYPHRKVTEIPTRALGPVDGLYLAAPGATGRRLRGLAAFLAYVPNGLARLRQYFRAHGVRAINVHYPSLAAFPLILARRLYDPALPLVLSFHGADLASACGAGAIDRWLWRCLVQESDALVACSQALAKQLRDEFPEAEAKVRVILNGIDPSVCRAAAATAELPPALNDRRYIASIGTFEDKKGQDLLLAAFPAIARAHPDLHLVLVGRSGPTLDPLRARAARDGLGDRIHFWIDQSHASTMAILSRAQLMVHPARQEPFGLVILEAASLGVPVIATRVGGIPEIIEDRRSGRLVPPDDPHTLAAVTIDMLADTRTARACADALRDDAENRFSWARAAALYAGLFRALPAASPEGGAPHSAGRSSG